MLCMCTECLPSALRAENRAPDPGTGATDSRETAVCAEDSGGPLQEQRVFPPLPLFKNNPFHLFI